MNHYVIRDANDSPQSATAETLDEALTTLGLDVDGISKAEVMIKGAMPPNNWQDVTPPKRKKLTVEQKIRATVLKEVTEVVDGMLDGMGMDSESFRKSDWAEYQKLKDEAGK